MGIFLPFSQHWLSSISLSDFISCQSTKKPFHFPLKPPTWYLLCFSNSHTIHSLSMAASLRNTERGTQSLTSQKKNQSSHTASPLGLQKKWLYPSPPQSSLLIVAEACPTCQNLLGFIGKPLRETVGGEPERERQGR